MEHPKHRKEELAARLLEIYPEIGAHAIDLALEFDHEKQAWVVTFTKGAHRLRTFLEKKDADACMEGVQCIYLGVQIAQLIKNFEGS
jgi:hypothetical protein